MAREAGDVIFFCGAGVSMQKAKLLSFAGLAQAVLDDLGASQKGTARALLKRAGRIKPMSGVGGLVATDRVFGVLEREFLPSEIRQSVARNLRPAPDVNIDAHRILVDLATSPAGITRLVTTNFDLLFEDCDPVNLVGSGPPRLPAPKDDSEFRGIVHLHGRVDASYAKAADEEFVISSADYGRAYLSDGWATRFMRDLIERYQIVFVGYTADDPPVQYLLEALNFGAGTTARMYAFQGGDEKAAAALWKHRGVAPICFDDSDGYSLLWDTLAAWAERSRHEEEWHRQLFLSAEAGPQSLTAHERSKVASVLSTAEGARSMVTTTPLPAIWLLALDAKQRFARPAPIDPQDEAKGLFDPYEVFGMEDDPLPPLPDDQEWRAERKIPDDARDYLAPRIDEIDPITNGVLMALRGSDVDRTTDLSPRLQNLARWLVKISPDPITLWWAAQQQGLHSAVRNGIEQALRYEPKLFSDAVRRGWRLLFAAWSDRRFDANQERYTVEALAHQEGWNSFLIKRYAAIYRPRLKIREAFAQLHPYFWNKAGELGQMIWVEVDYPRPHQGLTIPPEWLREAILQFRNNIDEAISLKRELEESDHLYYETTRTDDGASVSEDSYGLTGVIAHFQNLMLAMWLADREAARREYLSWPRSDNFIYARLRIWAVGVGLASASEAADILSGLPDDVFWCSREHREIVYALKGRWPDLKEVDREAIEHRLLTGRNPIYTESDHEESIAYSRLTRISWLHNAGVTLGFNADAEIAKLRELVPTWSEEAADYAAQSHAPVAYTVDTDTNPDSLRDVPLKDVLKHDAEAGRADFFSRVDRRPFRGLAQSQPARALAVLSLEAKKGEAPARAWSAFLYADARKTDRVRLMRLIVARLETLPIPVLASIAYPITEWMQAVGPRFYNDAAELAERIWTLVVAALRTMPVELIPKKKRGWADEALNAPVGRLHHFIWDDPQRLNLRRNSGLPARVRARLDDLLGLQGRLRLHAIVMISFHTRWLHYVDPAWARENLLPLADGDNDESSAFWEGVFWNAQVPQSSLYRRLKRGLLRQAAIAREKHNTTTILSGFILAGWGGSAKRGRPNGPVSSAELRELLIDADDDFRKQILWNLRQWSQGDDGWRHALVTFFADVWPRQRALRTPDISAKLAGFALESGDSLPALCPLILPRLVPIEGQSLDALFSQDENGTIAQHPKETLEILWAILAEDAGLWPYKTDDTLEFLASRPVTQGDARLSELRRRQERR